MQKEIFIKGIIRHKMLFFVCITAIFTSVYVVESSYSASNHKFIWGDEEATIVRDTSQSYISMIIDGVHGESSPEPLYYLLHKLTIQLINKFDANILFYHRIVSIIFAILTLTLFLIFLPKYIGFIPTLIAVLTLLSSKIFLYYAVEARPYMLWMFFIALLIFYAAEVSCRKEFGLKRSIFLLLINCGLVASALPGIAQFLCSILTCCFCWVLWPDKRSWKKNAIVCSFVTAIPFLIGIYYATREHVTKGSDAGYGLDLINTGNLKLLKSVIDQFFSFDSSFVVGIQNSLLIISLLFIVFFTIIKLSRKSQNDTSRILSPRPLLFLGLQVFSQLILALPLGFIVAISHYYFIPRAFLYLVLYKAILIGIGSFLVLNHFERDFPKIIRAFKVIILASFFIVLPTQLAHNFDFKFKDNVIDLSTRKAEPIRLSGKVAFYVIKGQELDISTNSIKWFFDEIARNKIESPGSFVTYVTFKNEPNANDWYSISQEIPVDAVPLVQSGKIVQIDLSK